MSEQHLFSFMESEVKDLASLGEEIELNLFRDPRAVILKARLYAETLAKLIWAKEAIQQYYDLKHVERLHKLYREDVLDENLYKKFEWLRKTGNKVAHEPDFGSVQEALTAHKYLYDISIWFFEVYVDYGFKSPEYKIPAVKDSAAVDSSELGNLISETLEKTLAASLEEKLKTIQEEIQKLKVPFKEEVPLDGLDKNEETEEKEAKFLFSLADYLKSLNLEVYDKRASGGSLWVVGGWELNEILFPLKEHKIFFRFAKNGSRTTKKQAGWFLIGNNKDEIFFPAEQKTSSKDDTYEVISSPDEKPTAVETSKHEQTEHISKQEQEQEVKLTTPNKKVRTTSIKIVEDTTEFIKAEQAQLRIPKISQFNKLQSYENTELQRFSDLSEITQLKDLTDDALRKYYTGSKEKFYNLLNQLSFIGCQVDGNLQKLAPASAAHTVNGYLEAKGEDQLKQLIPVHFANLFSRFGVHQVFQLNGIPLTSIKIFFEDFYEEFLSFIRDYDVQLEEGEQILEQQEGEPNGDDQTTREIIFKGKMIAIPEEKLNLQLEISSFPGCHAFVRGLLTMGINEVKDLPTKLDDFHQKIKGVGPRSTEKFWDLLLELLSVSEETAAESDPLVKGEQVSYRGEIITFPENMRNKIIEPERFVSLDSLFNYFEEAAIITYGDLPVKIEELSDVPRVGKRKVDKFFEQLRTLTEQFKKEQEMSALLKEMTENEKTVYYFKEFKALITEIIADEDTRKSFKVSDRALGFLKDKYECYKQGKHLTLEEMGQNIGLTRERVRQILGKAIGRLAGIGSDWLKQQKEVLKKEQIVPSYVDFAAFSDYIAYEVLESQDIRSIWNHQFLTNLQADVIGEYDRKIRDCLQSNFKAAFITPEDIAFLTKQMTIPYQAAEWLIKEYLVAVQNGQYIYSKSNKADLVELVMKQFPEGVQVYQNASNLCEMANAIVKDSFKSEREFTAIAGRDDMEERIYLWGRGTYIHSCFVRIDELTIEKILSKAAELLENRDIVSVGKLFSLFEKELVEKGIPNEYALYTCMRLISQEKLSFPRFPRIMKEGSTSKFNADQIKDFIRQQGAAVTVDALREEFIHQRGWKEFTLQFNLSLKQGIIRADWSSYSVIDFFDVLREEDLRPILNGIKSKLAASPYLQIRGVFNENESYCRGLGISNHYLLYDILQAKAGHLFKFIRYPHVLSLNTDVDHVNMKMVVEEYLLEQGMEVAREELIEWMVEEIGGRTSLIDNIVSQSNKIFYYSRGQYGEYIHQDVIGWNEEKSQLARNAVLSLLEKKSDRPFVLACDCIAEEILPELDIDIPWTTDLLADCLRRDPAFLLLGSMNTIILKADYSSIRTNTDFVAYLLEKECNGWSKLRELRKILQKFEYTSDGDLLQETINEMDKEESPIKMVGDEVMLNDVKNTGGVK